MPIFTILVQAEEITQLVEDMKGKEIDNALVRARNELHREALRLLHRPIRTWTTPVEFKSILLDGDGLYGFRIDTDSAIYTWVDKGTGLHGPRMAKYPIPKPSNLTAKTLRFQTGYKAKTKVGSLTSRQGGSYGPYTYRKSVMHPGIEGREFTDQVGNRIFEISEETLLWAIVDWWYSGHPGQTLPPSGSTPGG